MKIKSVMISLPSSFVSFWCGVGLVGRGEGRGVL